MKTLILLAALVLAPVAAWAECTTTFNPDGTMTICCCNGNVCNCI